VALSIKEELQRKTLHFLTVLIIAGYVVAARSFSHRVALLILAFLLIVGLELEYFRLESKRKLPILSKIYFLRRKKEKKQLGGEIFFLIGALIALAVFDLRIASAAILMTTFGDFAASLVGKTLGTTPLPGIRAKKLEGAIAELLVDLFIGFLLVRTLVDGHVWWLNSFVPFGEPVWPVIITMAFVATFVETITTKLDDNLLIPVFSGFFGQIVLMVISIRIVVT
jgi:dolichol kinase